MTHAYLIAIVDPKYVDVEERIEEMMSPYDENKRVSPYMRECDGCDGKGCKYCNNKGSEESTYNLKSEWDWYIIGGRWWGVITGKEDTGGEYAYDDKQLDANMTTVDKLPINENDVSYALLLPDGTWLSRETYSYEKKKFIVDESWVDKVAKEYKKYGKYTAVGIDYHI